MKGTEDASDSAGDSNSASAAVAVAEISPVDASTTCDPEVSAALANLDSPAMKESIKNTYNQARATPEQECE